jgi:hypothetical protein
VAARHRRARPCADSHADTRTHADTPAVGSLRDESLDVSGESLAGATDGIAAV